jgi:hypothetical protein
MERLIKLLTEIENISISLQKEEIDFFFTSLYDELVLKTTPEFDRQKDLIGYKLGSLLNSELCNQIIIGEIKKRLSFSRDRNDYDEIIINSLVSAETNGANSILIDILKSESYVLKAYIFYHRTCYPIPKIFQTEECKLSIINFINSDQFTSIYEERCNWPGYHSELFAFPGHYISCFDIKNFEVIQEEKFSTSKLSKLASKERLESIRLITNTFFKLELIKRYFNSLPILYKTRFVKLVDKTFPELELKKNGHYLYTRYL